MPKKRSEKIAKLRDLYAAFNRGDLDTVLEGLHPEIVWRTPETLPFGGTFKGHDEVCRFFTSLREHFTRLEVDVREMFSSGSRVVAIGRHRGEAHSGAFDIPFAMVWRFRDGQPIRFTEYQDTAATLRALA